MVWLLRRGRPALYIPPPPQPSSGWTDFALQGGSKAVYVSTSQGLDGNTGLGEGAPVATHARAFQVADPGDHILYRRGDTWSDWPVITDAHNGPASDHLTVLGAYGDEANPRPLFTGTHDYHLGNTNSLVNIAWLDLHMYDITHDPNHASYSSIQSDGLTFNTPFSNLWFEGCRFNFCELSFSSYDNATHQGAVTIRRCVVNNSWHDVNDGHASNIYADYVTNLLIEECVNFHGGWNEDVAEGEETQFNHAHYLSSNNRGITLRNNVICLASSHMAQLRAHGRCEGNVGVQNGWGAFVAGDNQDPDYYDWHLLNNNIVLHAVQRDYRTSGLGNTALQVFNVGTPNNPVEVQNNIAAFCDPSDALDPYQLDNPPGSSTIQNNYNHDWGSSNPDVGGPFPDPRDITDYLTSIGETATLDQFYALILQQRKGNWRADLMAENIAPWIRAGFGL